jgi:hypothetical protein
LELAIEQLAEMRATQTIDDENASEQDDFGSGRRPEGLGGG